MVAVRIGFDDNRVLGEKETGARAALPIVREIMLRLDQDELVGPVPRFPSDSEGRIDECLAMRTVREAGVGGWPPALADGLASRSAEDSASGTLLRRSDFRFAEPIAVAPVD